MARREEPAKPAGKREKITAQDMLDHAPSNNKKAYLKLPSDGSVKLFTPKATQQYKAIFVPWRAGKNNPAKKEGLWVTNRYLSVHRGMGPNEEMVLCPRMTAGKKCPQCEDFSARQQRQEAWESIKDLRPKNRELFLLHLLNDRDPKNLFIWDESCFLFGDGFRQTMSRRPRYKDFADLDDGLVIDFEGKEKKMGSGGGVCIDCTQGILFDEREYDLPDWLIEVAETICVDDFVTLHSYEKIKEMMGCQSTDDNGEADDDDRRDARRSRRGEETEAPARRRREVEEPPAEGEATPPVRRRAAESVAEEEPAPRRRREPVEEPETGTASRRAARPVEPEPVEDDPEETPPTPRRRAEAAPARKPARPEPEEPEPEPEDEAPPTPTPRRRSK